MFAVISQIGGKRWNKIMDYEKLTLCLYITEVSKLTLLDDPWADDGHPVSVYSNWVKRARNRLRKQLASFKPSRLYFGQEFCQRLLPSIKDLRTVMDAARGADMDFTLVTPYVTNTGLNRVESLLQVLSHEWPCAEVVCNDWGVLLRVKERFSKLAPVVGRLLEKMKRDPRFSTQDYRRFFSDRGFQLLQDSNATAPSYQCFLQSYGVVRLEFDNVPQGNAVDLSDAPYKGSVYAPYGFVTTGRICFIGSLNVPPDQKFRVDTPADMNAANMSSLCGRTFPLCLERRIHPLFNR